MTDHEHQLAICNEKWKQFDQHHAESIPIRDTVKRLEIRMDIVERNVTKNAIIGGLIGALIGSGASPAIIHIVELFLKIGG